MYRIRGDWILYTASALSCIAPLLMALANPAWTYWAAAFPAATLNAIQVDAFFTIASLLITSAFGTDTQALAGGVFNTVAQIGRSVGLALAGLLAESVTAKSSASRENDGDGGRSQRALLEGYRAVFWLCFAMCLMTQLTSFWGLHGIGKVGLLKKE